ncbi:TraX family protein [Petrocella sp. FN5]|uniref:TraX family protein n=1 Tax=Petrocella sp. FN5 TaxID=3032002 RepID=UPI0023DB4197|nr:TraX family protein [Petrocella sp. FN5]MDF1617808.1 TraX family protein [Petrocella sp. FN5]
MSNTNLKIIACITMLIDHIGAILYPDVSLLRMIGRLSFPIFTFLIVEGFHHTKNIKKYGIRLGIFALISEIPYDLAFRGNFIDFYKQNIFFTLFLGLVCLWLYHRYKAHQPMLAMMAVLLIGALSVILRTDYTIYGISMIFLFDFFRDKRIIACGAVGAINFMMGSMVQGLAIFALPLILAYNGKKGIHLKFLFYGFYPVHLMVLYLIKIVWK